MTLDLKWLLDNACRPRLSFTVDNPGVQFVRVLQIADSRGDTGGKRKGIKFNRRVQGILGALPSDRLLAFR